MKNKANLGCIYAAEKDLKEAKTIQEHEAARCFLLGLLRGLYEAGAISAAEKEAIYNRNIQA